MKKTFGIITYVLIFIVCFWCGKTYLGAPYDKKPSIAIVYVATSRYFVFWEEFYKSMEEMFLPDYRKHYFVFTDREIPETQPNVTHVYREWHGFPDDSLDRFEMFLGIENQLKKYDYIYFLNANALVVSPIGSEIIPSKEQKLVVAWHPQYYKEQKRTEYPYERNPQSTAYIPMDKGQYYVQGSLSGGETQAYLEMCRQLVKNIYKDKKQNIIAKWHDESHLNYYIVDKNPLILSPNYNWTAFDLELQDKYQIENSFKIVMRDKGLVGGYKWLRHPGQNISEGMYYLNHDGWADYFIPQNSERTIYCRKTVNDCARIEKSGETLKVIWDKWGIEEFIYSKENEQYEWVKNSR